MQWLGFVLGKSRGPRNMLRRLPTIAARFGVSSQKIEAELETLLAITESHGARPSLPVTAMTARRHPAVLHRLAERGVELAAHGYVHNDWSALSPGAQQEQARRARTELEALGLRVSGWRCPYSRCNEHTMAAVRAAGFAYDSTPTFAWPAYEEEGIALTGQQKADYDRLCLLFGVRDARREAVLPTMLGDLVQIPMSIPQDEDMVDRLHLDAGAMSRVWQRILHASRQHGEAFVLCLHPERVSLCAEPLEATLSAARALGDVWMARLEEIAEWWRERSRVSLRLDPAGPGTWRLTVSGSPRAAVRWQTASTVGPGSTTLHTTAKPAVRCGPVFPEATRRRLAEVGYLVEQNGAACNLDLASLVPPTATPDEALRAVQGHDAELVRLAPWPAGYRSCLSVTGDIDALTLFDFAMRLKEF